MQKQELLSLEWERHVDLKHGFILLDITKNGRRREIPINQPLRDTLEGLVRRVDSAYVFTDSDGKRFQDGKKAFYSACRRAEIKDLRFHDLRHTFTSHLVMQGVDLTSVKELLGHKTLTMTRRYAHPAPSPKVKAVALLGGIVGPKSNIQKSRQFEGNADTQYSISY
jgi:integrase